MNIRSVVAYDGSAFHGFAVNEGVRTVAGDIEAALAQVLGAPVTLTCAGRTDKGVHARGQVISFAAPDDTDPARLERSINQMCRPAIVLRDSAVVDDDFDARFSAKWRLYRYQVLTGPTADPMLHDRTWHVPEPLDLHSMNEALAHLVGEHDFCSFCRRPKVAEGEAEASLVREVIDAEWSVAEADDRILELWIQATSFCHQMVRSIVGTTVDVGLRRIEVSSVPEILAARDRAAAGRVAPPEGLTLWEVGY